MAEFAKNSFQEWFAEYLTLYQGDVEKTFKAIMGDISIDITSKNLPWTGISSKAVVCYVDTNRLMAHIGTVGDSFACLVKEKECIPLSFPNRLSLRGHTGNPKAEISSECVYQEHSIAIGDLLVLLSHGRYEDRLDKGVTSMIVGLADG